MAWHDIMSLWLYSNQEQPMPPCESATLQLASQKHWIIRSVSFIINNNNTWSNTMQANRIRYNFTPLFLSLKLQLGSSQCTQLVCSTHNKTKLNQIPVLWAENRPATVW